MPQQITLKSNFETAVVMGLMLIASVALVYKIGDIGLMALLGLAAASVFAFLHPLVPFAMYFGALFFKDTTIGNLHITVNQILAPLFFVSTFLYWLRNKTLPIKFPLLPVLALAMAYFALRGLTAENFPNGILYARYVVIYLVMSICVAICMYTERTILALAWIIVFLTAAAAAGGFYEAIDKDLLGSFTGNWGAGFRVKGTAPNSIVYGWNMLYAFPFAFLLFAEMRSRYTRALALLFGIIILGAATLTFNRQTYVLMALIIALCSWLYSYRNRTFLLGLLGVFGTGAAFTVLPLILKRFLTVTTLSSDYSFLERRDSYLLGLEMLKKSPIFGVGFGSFSKVWQQYIPKDYSTYYAQYRGGTVEKFMDMGYMAVSAETGILGLLIFLTILITILVRAWRYRQAAVAVGDTFARNLASTVLVILMFISITSMIQDTFLYTRVWIFYGVAMLLDERVLPIRTDSAELPSDHNSGHEALAPDTP